MFFFLIKHPSFLKAGWSIPWLESLSYNHTTLHSFLFYLAFFWLTCMCVPRVCVCVFRCLCRSKGWHWEPPPILLYLFIEAGTFNLSQSSSIWLVWLASLFWRVPFSPFRELELQAGRLPHPLWHLYGFWGSKFQSSHLCVRYSSHWYFSPALI